MQTFFYFCCEGFTTDVLACWGYPPKLKGIAVTSSAAQIVARISGHDSFCTWVGICSAEHLQRSNDFARKCPHYCSPTPPHPRSTCTHVIKTSSRNTFVSEAADDGNSFHQPVKDGSNKPRRFLMTPPPVEPAKHKFPTSIGESFPLSKCHILGYTPFSDRKTHPSCHHVAGDIPLNISIMSPWYPHIIFGQGLIHGGSHGSLWLIPLIPSRCRLPSSSLLRPMRRCRKTWPPGGNSEKRKGITQPLDIQRWGCLCRNISNLYGYLQDHDYRD